MKSVRLLGHQGLVNILGPRWSADRLGALLGRQKKWLLFSVLSIRPLALEPIVNYDVLHRMSLLAMALDLHELDITDIEFIASFEAMEHAYEFILLVLRQ